MTNRKREELEVGASWNAGRRERIATALAAAMLARTDGVFYATQAVELADSLMAALDKHSENELARKFAEEGLS